MTLTLLIALLHNIKNKRPGFFTRWSLTALQQVPTARREEIKAVLETGTLALHLLFQDYCKIFCVKNSCSTFAIYQMTSSDSLPVCLWRERASEPVSLTWFGSEAVATYSALHWNWNWKLVTETQTLSLPLYLYSFSSTSVAKMIFCAWDSCKDALINLIELSL